MPELTKVFDQKIMKPIDYNILAGLGMIELEALSGSRQEANLNPKFLVEEIVDMVLDNQEIYEEVIREIKEKNPSTFKNKTVRVVPGVIKSALTPEMRKLIKDFSNTGNISLESGYEALPQGFDFEINAAQRKMERDNELEGLFFPRVILNQDNGTVSDIPRQNITPQEIPQKKNEPVEANEEYIEAPYKNNDSLPKSIKVLPSSGQTLWRKVFNDSLKNGDSEEVCIKKAWGVVKKAYKKNKNEKWVKASVFSTIDDIDKEIKSFLSIKDQINFVKE